MSNVFVAYHDKMSDQSTLYDNHAVIVDAQYEPFLITRFDLYFLSLQELTTTLKTYKARTSFKKKKRGIAAFFLALALPFALFYFLLTLGIINYEVPPILLILIKQEIFFAAFSLLVLWHDVATSYDAAKSLPKYPELDDILRESIEQQGVQFQQYLIQSPLEYFHPITIDLLISALKITNHNSFLDTATLLSAAIKNENVKHVLEKLEITNVDELIKRLPLDKESTPIYPYVALQSIVLYATEQAILSNSNKVLPEHVLLALFSVFPVLDEVLQQFDIQLSTFTKTIAWYTLNEQRETNLAPFNLQQTYYKKGGIADNWVHGETYYLDILSTDIVRDLSREESLIGIGHTKEVNTVIGILQKEYNANIFFVGEKGVGKSNVIYTLAQRILDGDVPAALKGIKIKSMNIAKLVALATGGRVGIAAMTEKLATELRRQANTLLYFDDLEQLLTTGIGESTVIAYILPILLQSNIPIIGTTTYEQYIAIKEKTPQLLEYFKEVPVDEPSPEDTFMVLMTRVAKIEKRHQISISIPALQDIITLTGMYMPREKYPKKAVDLLEQAAITAAQSTKQVTRELIKNITQSLVSAPISNTTTQEVESLLTLEKRIHQRYINQRDAVLAIVDALQRSKTMTKSEATPLSTLLFIGPSGVGKTELAKIAAEEFFAEEFSLVRIDLAAYANSPDVEHFINQLHKVSLKSHALLMLDEIDKTPPEFVATIQTILETGALAISNEAVIYFNHCVIVATSNFGSEKLLITPPDEFESARLALQEALPTVIDTNILAQFNKIVVFEPLTLEHLQQITFMYLSQLSMKLSQQNIQLQYTNKSIAFIVAQSFVPQKGARPIVHYIQKTIEPEIVRQILESQKTTGRNPNSINIDSFCT
jgi:ATP-dependent Clp protease ATP-binding subunit ClpA